MSLTWNDSFNTHVAIIDQQHRKLVNLVNDLSSAMKVGKSKDVIEDVLSVLVNYTKTHFATEERLMKQVGFSGLSAHAAIHAEFIQKVADFEQKVKTGSAVVSIEILDFLSKWIVDHIKGADAQYVPALKGNV